MSEFVTCLCIVPISIYSTVDIAVHSVHVCIHVFYVCMYVQCSCVSVPVWVCVLSYDS